MEREREAAVSVSKVESSGNSTNVMQPYVGEGEPGMSEGIAGIQLRRLLVLLDGSIESAIVGLLHQRLGRLEGGKRRGRMGFRFRLLVVI